MAKCTVMLTLNLTKSNYITQEVIYLISRLRLCYVEILQNLHKLIRWKGLQPTTTEENKIPRNAGGSQDKPQATWTKFMMKKGAQQMMKEENTTPRTLLAFSSDWDELEILLKLF